MPLANPPVEDVHFTAIELSLNGGTQAVRDLLNRRIHACLKAFGDLDTDFIEALADSCGVTGNLEYSGQLLQEAESLRVAALGVIKTNGRNKRAMEDLAVACVAMDGFLNTEGVKDNEVTTVAH